MAVSRTARRPERIVPDTIEATMRRWAVQLMGIVILLTALMGWLCLLTWSIKDPSLNNAASGETRNILGSGGAGLADLLFQTTGLASIFVFLPLAAWGWHCIAYRFPGAIFFRLLLWPISIFCLSGAFSAIPKVGFWPLPNGFGGVLGDVILSAIPGLLSTTLMISSLLLGLTGALCMLLAIAVRPKDLAILLQSEKSESRGLLGLVFGGIAAVLRAIKNGFSQMLSGDEADDQRARMPHHQKGFANISEKPDQAALWKSQKGTDGWKPPRFFGNYPKFSNDDEGDEDGQAEKNLSFDFNDRLTEYADDETRRRISLAPIPVKEKAKSEDVKAEKDSAQPKAASKNAAKGKSGKAKAAAHFVLPSTRLLAKPVQPKLPHLSKDMLTQNALLLQEVLSDFGIMGTVTHVHPGPVVTLYEFEPARGTKSARVIGLANDIARSMSAVSARVAVIPGRNAIGIELPNEGRETVFLRALMESKDYTNSAADLPLALGKSINGDPVIVDLARMPHVLIAGTTGSGKSVGINAMILSLLYRLTPDQCKFIMIDPKMLELSVYDGIPHLLSPVVTEPKKAVVALKWVVQEMEERYKKMSKLNVRNISGYNARVAEAKRTGEKLTRVVQTGFDKETGDAIYETEEMDYDPMPFIVVVIDEMADLMMVAGKDIEAAVQRLAQMARAAGIHLMMATQRPSVDVITGTIKANFPTRISYQVSSKIDSRTILGEQGAEQLLGAGDMLYMAGAGRIVRVHGPFVSDDEIEDVVKMLCAQASPEYLPEITELAEQDEMALGEDEEGSGREGDSLYDAAVDVVLRDQKVSISYVQRRLSIGYNKAASLIERMETEGLISSPNRAGKREILVN